MVSKVQILSSDIGMESGIKRCHVLVLKRGKVVSSKGVESGKARQRRSFGENILGERN